MTKYAVLSKQAAVAQSPSAAANGETIWKVEKMVDAQTAKAAVAAVVKDLAAKEGTFIAVPVRSWKPIRVKAEQKTTITFS